MSHLEFECSVVTGRGITRCADGEKVQCRVSLGAEQRLTGAAAVRRSETQFSEPAPFRFTVNDVDDDRVTVELVQAANDEVLGSISIRVADFKQDTDEAAGIRQYRLSNNAGYVHLKMRLARVVEETKSESRYGILHYAFLALNVLLGALAVTVLVQGAASSSSWAVELSIGTLLPKAMIAVAVISVMFAAAACYAITQRTSTWMRAYSYLTVCLVLLQLIIGSLCIGALAGTAAQMEHGWDVWRGDADLRLQLRQLEADLECCGFSSFGDRAVDPCPTVAGKAELPGCASILEGRVDSQLRRLGGLGLAISILQVVAVAVACLITRDTDSKNASVDQEEDGEGATA